MAARRVIASNSVYLKLVSKADRSLFEANADTMTVITFEDIFGKTTRKGLELIKSADMAGPVKIVYVKTDPATGSRTTTVSTADKAFYNGADMSMKLTGNVKIVSEDPKGTTVMTAEVATAYLKAEHVPRGHQVHYRLPRLQEEHRHLYAQTPTRAQGAEKVRLEARNLVKSYKGRRVGQRRQPGMDTGEIVGLLGPNGAGKTTTFYMMVGLVRPTMAGCCSTADITAKPMYLRARMGLGYLAQEPSVFRKLTVAENMLLVLEMPASRKKERLQRTDSLLEEFGLTDVRDSQARCSPAASGGAWRSPGRWQPIPSSSCSTSRSPESTR